MLYARRIILGVLAFAAGGCAASIDGAWTGVMEIDLNQHSASRKSVAPDQVGVTFTFAVKGNEVTGSMVVNKGNKPDKWIIRKGRIVGSAISFEAFRRKSGTMDVQAWNGTITATEIKLSRGMKGLGRQVILKRK